MKWIFYSVVFGTSVYLAVTKSLWWLLLLLIIA